MPCPKCQKPILDGSNSCPACQSSTRSSEDTATCTLLSHAFGELPPGARIAGKFRIIEIAGQGGMGVVYKAEDTKLRRTVALKFLPPQLAHNAELRERFLIEARAAAAITHPNICTIHEIHDQEAQPFIEMEYVEGRSLRSRIRDGPLPPSEAAEIAAQVAEALELAHRKGIVHRDIKSANIMVTGSAEGRGVQAKVMDFGLAKIRGDTAHTREGSTLGTVAYMSPEQAEGRPVDHRTDVWSLGVVLYELLTGRLPFQGDRDTAVLYSVVHAEAQPVKKLAPEVPSALCEIVDRALRKNLNARYRSAAEMAAGLRRYQESQTTALSGALRRLRQPRFAVPLAACLLTLFAAGAWWIRRQSQIRWARETALPEIERLVVDHDVWRSLVKPYRLALQAEQYLPGDPKLAALISRCSVKVDINSEPPGAAVYMKEYSSPDSPWEPVGTTPIQKARLPIGIFRWKFEKEGFTPVLAAASTWDIKPGGKEILTGSTLSRTMDKIGTAPTGMVRVPETQTSVGILPGFFIDSHEVTNRQYMDFVRQGGYRNQNYWQQRFVQNGRDLSWSEAMKLFVDSTGQPGPASWQAGDYPEEQDAFPVSGVSWYEAAAYATYAGKSLPTAQHWTVARGTYTPMFQFPQLGGFAVIAPFVNFRGKGLVPVGSLPGISAYGLFDMAGNVREWCSNETPLGRLLRGGAWDDDFRTFMNLGQAPPMDRSPRNGFRCALYADPAAIPERAQASVKLLEFGDFYRHKPVPDPVYQAYLEQFSYDRTDLHARVESRKNRPGGWIHEKITFDAAYGGERIIAHLFLPANRPHPFQAVIYFPGGVSAAMRSSEDIENYYEFPLFLSFIVKSGRAALYPVYKGTFERGATLQPRALQVGDESHAYTEYLAQVVRDFRKCLDYLETREDIAQGKFAFYGVSWGGMVGAVIPAVEDRLKASVLLGGGIVGRGRPEANQLTYVTHVKIPTLMLGGRYDTLMDPQLGQKPMFDLLGTTRKRWILFETDHIPPRNEMIKETLAWLDQYLGPVK